MKENDLNFDDLDLIEISIPIDGAVYTLREASEDAAAKYQNALSRCTQLTDGKVSGITGPLADSQSLLVSLCLFDEKGRFVPQSKVRQWPSRVVKRLFEKAAEISEIAGESDTEESLQKTIDETQEKLDELRADELGNEQSDTTAESA